MQYMGGKFNAANWIVPIISEAHPGADIWEPFCGGANMTTALAKAGHKVRAGDAREALITMYQALLDGWRPDPREATPERYALAKAEQDPTDPMTAFLLAGCSFGGVWGAAYVGLSNHGPPMHWHHKPATSASVLWRAAPVLLGAGCTFEHVDFFDIEPGSAPERVLYLDPPYRDTTAYPGLPPFDHDRFDALCMQWAEHATVYVSEYSFPHGVEAGRSETFSTVSRDKTPKPRTERLFRLGQPGTSKQRDLFE